jgi:hypothetical protein
MPLKSDPWRQCELIFDENEGHFIERAKDRSYSGPDYREFLIRGEKEKSSVMSENGQDYLVTLGRWVIKCKVRRCNIVLGTIYLKK